MKKALDFQNDKILSLIFKTSIPLILASMVTMIVQLANISFMGNVGSEEIYIRSLYTPFAFLSIAFTEAFQISHQVLISRLKGSENYETIRKGILNFIFISVISSLLLAVFIYALAPFIADFYKVPTEITGDFISFLRAMFLVNALVILTMVLTSGLRGYGNVNLSMVFNIVYALLNVTLVYVLAFYLNKGIYSIVYANLISSVFTSLVVSIVLFKKKILQLNRKYFAFYKQAVLFLRNVGLPISISYLIIFISNFFFNKIVAPFGVEAVSGFGVAYYIQTFVIVPGIAIGGSLGIIMNNNIGGGDRYHPRVFEAYKKGVAYTAFFYFVLTAAIYIFSEAIINTMVKDQTAFSYANDFISIVSPSYIIMGIVLMTITTLEQINKGVIALVLNTAYFAIITTLGWYLTRLFDDLNYFYWTFFAVNLFGVICVIYTWKVLENEYASDAIIEKGEGRMYEN
jgi:Na+-driven multidrug efflux pump